MGSAIPIHLSRNTIDPEHSSMELLTSPKAAKFIYICQERVWIFELPWVTVLKQNSCYKFSYTSLTDFRAILWEFSSQGPQSAGLPVTCFIVSNHQFPLSYIIYLNLHSTSLPIASDIWTHKFQNLANPFLVIFLNYFFNRQPLWSALTARFKHCH